MSPHKSSAATISNILVFYDGPQLLLLKDEHGKYLLGHAIEREGFKYPVFCCQMLERHLSRYLYGKVDLRFVFMNTPKSRLYFADLGKKENPIELKRAKASDIDESVYPEPGIFSTTHTHPLGGVANANDDPQRFNIDGVWEARDFSQFHGKLADTYSLLFIAQKLDSAAPSKEEALFLRSSISEKPWKGGGSYLSFYGGVKEDAVSLHPLRVAGIEYHSPGYIDLAGNREVLSDIIRSINDVIRQEADIVKNYRAIYKSLKAEGLLGANKDYGFSNQATVKYVLNQTFALAQRMSLPNGELILNACDGNVAVFAKLVLSYYRRIKGLSNFVVEGRVRAA